ncbi:hypothetical protein O3M35_012127 [Rhynocoris fuscipes]|uniref:PDZ domain-containing protein n=1 Tax=Rhynocoris fuscipes TaxID=488301 RepID=A0AAW1CSP0_9HEMI
METIFVQSVTPDSGAAKAGLNIGDRLLGVNGKSVHNKTYSAVVHMIQESPDYLCLIVVPKEEDLIQLFFGRTAHNPETNERPNRASSRTRGSSGISSDTVKSSGSPARRSVPSLPPVQAPLLSPRLDKMPVDSVDPEQASATAPRQHPGRANTLPEMAATVPGCLTPIGANTGYTNNAFWDSLNALSFNSHNHENVMSRLRKSLRQKEEFLCSASSSSSTSPLHSSAGSVGPTRSGPAETVTTPQSRLPQRITTPPVWPPAIPASSVPQAIPKEVTVRHPPPHSPGFVYGGAVTNAPKIETRSASLGGVESLPTVVRLDRIQEERGGQRQSPSKQSSVDSAMQSIQQHPPCFRLVSQRARQFESAHSLQPNIHLYRSELARLATKRGAPNVAVRRREFESRAADWRHHRESSLSPTPSSGNRTIPIGSTKLHCDPPKDYHDSSASETKAPTRPRSNSVETLPIGRMSPRSVSSDPPQQRHKAVRQDSYLAAVNKPVSHLHHSHHQQQQQQHQQDVSNEDKKKKKKYSNGTTPATVNDKRKDTPKIKIEAPSPKKKPERPNRLDLVTTNRPSVGLHNNRAGSPSPIGTPDSETKSPQETSPGLDSVVRRSKPSLDDQGSEDERATRRVSYLKATWGDRIHVDSDLELSDNEPIPSPHRSVVAVPQKDQDIIIEGPLYCKVTQLDGKKAGDRSWRSVWVVVRGNSLYLFKDKKDAFSEVSTIFK